MRVSFCCGMLFLITNVVPPPKCTVSQLAQSMVLAKVTARLDDAEKCGVTSQLTHVSHCGVPQIIQCSRLTGAGLAGLGACTALHSMELTWCHGLTDAGLATVATVAPAAAPTLRLLRCWGCMGVSPAGASAAAVSTARLCRKGSWSPVP